MKRPTHRQTAAFIRQTCRLCGPRLDAEEREMEGWAGYLEACCSYRACAGRRTFWEHAFLCIREHMDALRRAEAERRRLESPLPWDGAPQQELPGASAWRQTCQGDFVNTLQLRDYLARLPGEEKAVAWGYINRESDGEICAAQHLTPAGLAAVRASLAAHLQEYLAA